MIDLADIRAAALAIAPAAIVTPVLRSDDLDDLTGASLFAKDESQQRAGAFKFRGAYHRLSLIAPEDRSRGVVAVSSGNHGAAVACAASLLGMHATIHVTRKETGKVDTYEVVGTVEPPPEPQKEQPQ